jgi:hypothetical protein
MQLVHHAETVALAQIAVEVDVAAEHIAELHRDAVRDAGFVGGGEQRALHDARFHRDAGVELGAVVGHAEMPVRFGNHLDQRLAARKEAQHQRLAVGAHLGADVGAGPQLVQHAQLRKAGCVRSLDAEALDERGQGIAALVELLAEVGCGRRRGVRADRERLDDRALRRLDGALRGRRDGRERHHAGSGEERDGDDTAEAAEEVHESATIPSIIP